MWPGVTAGKPLPLANGHSEGQTREGRLTGRISQAPTADGVESSGTTGQFPAARGR
jgi:hypothetical protein